MNNSIMSEILNNKKLRENFKIYCIKENNEENLNFIISVQKFKNITDKHKLLAEFLNIYNDFILSNILNVSKNHIKKLESFVFTNEISNDLYNELYHEIIMNLRDIVIRYVKSDEYTDFLSNIHKTKRASFIEKINNKIKNIGSRKIVSHCNSFDDEAIFIIE